MGAQFFRAQPRARPHGGRQWILLTKEILFDYLIASVAQKLTDLAQIQLRAKLFKNGGGMRPMSTPRAQHDLMFLKIPLHTRTTVFPFADLRDIKQTILCTFFEEGRVCPDTIQY